MIVSFRRPFLRIHHSGGGSGNSGVSVAVNPTLYNNNPLAGPYSMDNSYTFGDWSGGVSAAKAQAEAQARLDYAQWVRSENSAQNQRAWEQEMSNTQVQRAMKDLEAAGLNPWLAVQSAGFGGSVPSGASASSSAGQAAAGKGGSGTLAGIGTAAAGIAMLFKTVAKIIK